MELIKDLAEHRQVEQMVENIARRSLTQDLRDLTQMVYIILLEYDEDKIIDLWEHDQMQYFLARIVINQYRSRNSTYHYAIRKCQQRSADISEAYNIADE